MQRTTRHCPTCGAVAYPSDVECLTCGLLLTKQQLLWREQDRVAQEKSAAENRRQAMLSTPTSNTVKCMACREHGAQTRCDMCGRLVCERCVAQFEPELLCASCAAVTDLLGQPDVSVCRVISTMQNMEPGLARRRPKRLHRKVTQALQWANSATTQLGLAGAEHAQSLLCQPLRDIGAAWGVSTAAPNGAHALQCHISTAPPTPEQINICNAILGSLHAVQCYGTKIDAHVMEIAANAGIPAPQVWLSPLEVPNALAVGFTASYAHIIVTEGLKNLMSDTELRAVLGHEVGHILHADSARNTALAAKALGIVLGGEIIGDLVAYGFLADGVPGNDWLGITAGIAIHVAVRAAAMHKLSSDLHRAEFAADAASAELAEPPAVLASALYKLAAAQNTSLWGGIRVAETSHMYAVPTGWSSSIGALSTHPDTSLRIAALNIIGEVAALHPNSNS